MSTVIMVCPFQIIDDEKGSKTLAFSCEICSRKDPDKGDITDNAYCRQQFLKILPFLEETFPCQFTSSTQTVSLPRRSAEILKEYVLIVEKLEPHVQKIVHHYPEIREKLFTEPFSTFKNLEQTYKFSKDRSILEIISSLAKTRLISHAKNQIRDDDLKDQKLFLENYLQIQKTPLRYSSDKLFEEPFELLSTYEVGPFRVGIFEFAQFPLEKFYQVVLSLDVIHSQGLLQTLLSQQRQFSLEEAELQNLDSLITSKITDFTQHLMTNFKELSSTEQKNFSIYATAQILNLTKTLPLLLDDEVQEIFLDKPVTAYYIDHAIWGRCKTNLIPSQSELSHIITRLRLESRRPLDEKNPSLKTELKTKLFHVRAAIDIPPLAYEGAHLNIRKIRLRTFTLPELVANGTISLSAAAFLVLCMNLRINITICGEPATGKTTLANAINLLAPPNWRKIAIEDTLESITFDEGNRHKVTFQVAPFDSFDQTHSTKSNEIIRLLHRSPDWVFLGEIQTAEHSSAMFHAISAGIRGIQTCHANSNQELLLRWQVHHNIPEVCFQSLGLLVHMVREVIRGQVNRKVAQISEVQFDSGNVALKPIFEWNNTSGHLEQRVADLFSPLISRTCKFQRLKQIDIRKQLRVYRETLADLVSKQAYDPEFIVRTFDETYASESPSTSNIVKIQKERKGGEKSSIISVH